MPSVFRRSVEELLAINLFQACLFLFGPGMTAEPQKALEPEAFCRAKMYEHYRAVVTLSFFFLFSTFASAVSSGYVKVRLPDAPDAGLQTLAPKRRRVMRVFAGIGWLLNVGASVLALGTFTFVLQAKLGLFQCLPAATRVGVMLTYVVLGSVLLVVYGDNGWRLMTAAH